MQNATVVHRPVIVAKNRQIDPRKSGCVSCAPDYVLHVERAIVTQQWLAVAPLHNFRHRLTPLLILPSVCATETLHWGLVGSSARDMKGDPRNHPIDFRFVKAGSCLLPLLPTHSCGQENSGFTAKEWIHCRGGGIIGCAVKRRWSTAGINPPGNWFAPPGSNQSSSGGNETAEASGAEGR